MKITRKTIWIFKRRLVVIFVRNSFTKQNYNVTDHCHRTGEYRREAYNMCNINIFSNKYLPVFFHNLKGCDGHLIRREGLTINQDIGDDEISAIPNSNEKYISFKIGEMTFIHFYAFLCESLDKLVKNVYDKEIHSRTTITWKIGEHIDLLWRKGFYPYEWVDGIEKLDYEGIPPIEACHSQLKHESVLYDDDDTKTMKRRRIRKPSSNKIMSIAQQIMMLLNVIMSGTTTWHIFIAMCCFLQMSLETSGGPALNTMSWTPQIFRQLYL